MLVVSLGVLCQSRLRGGSTPEDVATRYVAALRSGDRITLFLLSHPDAQLTAAFNAHIEKYRNVPAESLAIKYEPHPIAYFLTAVITVDGKRFDEVRLEEEARRWYIVQINE